MALKLKVLWTAAYVLRKRWTDRILEALRLTLSPSHHLMRVLRPCFSRAPVHEGRSVVDVGTPSVGAYLVGYQQLRREALLLEKLAVLPSYGGPRVRIRSLQQRVREGCRLFPYYVSHFAEVAVIPPAKWALRQRRLAVYGCCRYEGLAPRLDAAAGGYGAAARAFARSRRRRR